MDAEILRLKNWLLVITFFLLWLTVYLPDPIQQYLAYAGILTIGILHGANDLALLKAVPGGRQLPAARSLGLYLLFVATAVLCFYIFPGIGLVLFLVFSSFHFGEQHWKSKLMLRPGPSRIFYTAYGLLILSLLFICQRESVGEVILQLTGIQPELWWYPLALGVSAMVFTLYLAGNFKRLHASLWREGLYLLVFYLAFRSTGLLWGFAIYFILWHAIPSLVDQMRFLYGSLSRENLFRYLRTAFIYWGVSLLGLGLLYLLIGYFSYSFLPVFFAFLAAITFPHVMVIGKINRRD